MSDDRVDYLWRAFTWRFAAHVPWWDLRQIKAEAASFDDWCAVWSAWGDRHAAAGRHLTAALCFHWASFLFPHDEEQFRAALARMDEEFRQVEPNVPVAFEDVELPGYLLRPAGATKLAVICPGGDSTKEEFYAVGREIARRGIAVYGFDGPGHGAVSLTHKPLREGPPGQPGRRPPVHRRGSAGGPGPDHARGRPRPRDGPRPAALRRGRPPVAGRARAPDRARAGRPVHDDRAARRGARGQQLLVRNPRTSRRLAAGDPLGFPAMALTQEELR